MKTIGTISGSEQPILIDTDMHQTTTGNQMTGTAHQTVSVKNCSIANMSENGDQSLIDVAYY